MVNAEVKAEAKTEAEAEAKAEIKAEEPGNTSSCVGAEDGSSDEARVSSLQGKHYNSRKAKRDAEKPDWRYDLLREQGRKHVLKVAATGLGICSKCRWRHGCHMCDKEKALRYYLSKQGYLGPAVWNC